MHRLAPDPAHEVRVVDGRFTAAVCSCGWTGGSHRNRSRARQEARDHALLYVDAARPTSVEEPAPSRQDAPAASPAG